MDANEPAPPGDDRPWMTAPALSQLTKQKGLELRRVKDKLARKFRLRSWWYLGLKVLAIFYALIISNIRVIAGPSTDWVFHLLNVFALLILVVDFCLQRTVRPDYFTSLAAWVYLVAILFTFFDFSFFSVGGFQAIEFTVYFKLLFLIDPLFFHNTFFVSILAGFWNFLTQRCRAKNKIQEKKGFVEVLADLNRQHSEKRTSDKVRKEFVRDSVRAAAVAPVRVDPLVLEKQRLFSDVYSQQGKAELGSPSSTLGNLAALHPNAQCSEKVIRGQVQLQLIIWQIVICLVLACFYPNWVKFTSGYSALQNIVSFNAKTACDASQVQADIRNSLVNNSFENTKVLTVELWRVRTGALLNQQLEIFSQLSPESVQAIYDDYRSYELLTIDSSATNSGLRDGQCYLVSLLDNRRYYKMVAVMNILRAIVVLALINIYFQLFANRTIRDSSAAFNLGVDFCRLIKLNISKGGSLAWDKYNQHQAAVRESQRAGRASQKRSRDYGPAAPEEPVTSANRKLIQTAAFLKSGFGEAGIEFLRGFLADERNNNAIEVDCVVSFLEIRDFDSILDKIDVAIVDFLSEVAEIIAKNIEKGGGFSNKNSEAYFLLVWRCKGENRQKISQDALYSLIDAFYDCDRRAHGLTIQEFKRTRRFPGSDFDPEHKTLPDFGGEYEAQPDGPLGLKIGVGIHFGRVTEGGVGSQFKIDISYLSREVNMASRIQSVTKQFGLRLLVSKKFVANLGLDYAECLRPVDRVFLKGSAEEVELFTYDGIMHGFLTEEARHKWEEVDFADEGAKIQNLRECLGTDYTNFLADWMDGYHNYVAGHFEEAVPFLEAANEWCQAVGDRSAQTLLDVIRRMGEGDRKKWNGARKLDQK